MTNSNPFETTDNAFEQLQAQGLPRHEDYQFDFGTNDNPFEQLTGLNAVNLNTINVVVKATLPFATELELEEASDKTLLTTALRSELQLLGSVIHHLDVNDTSIDFTANLPTHLSVEKLIRSSETKLQTVWLMEKKQSLLFQTANAESVAAIH